MDRGYSCVGRGLAVSAANFPGKLALKEVDGVGLTYRELNEAVNRLAHFLLGKGLRKGDHVAILSQNTLEHVVALYATAKIGGVAIALDPRGTAAEVARALSFFDCKILILDGQLKHLLATTDMRHLPCGVIEYGKSNPARSELIDMVADMPAGETGIEVFDHDPFTMILTSGTTGMPKGCIRSHRNVEIGCIKDIMGKGLDSSSRELVVVPVYYGTGRGSVMGQIYLGGTVHMMPSFDAERVVDYIQREKISAIALAPTMCARILKLPNLGSYDLSSLRSLRKAGSPFPLPVLKELVARVTPHVFQGFASTESGGVTMLKPHEQLAKPGSSGLPRWGVEIEIIDADGKRLPHGSEGEIRVRGANVCMGYYKNPEEQARVFRDGWYHTGDLGRVDEDGHLYVVGRSKDMIKTGSINVSPREVEAAILDMDGVEDAAVVGVPDVEWGEAIRALVVLADGVSIPPEAIIAHCRKTLAGFKAPKQVRFTSHIGRNALGKLTAEFKQAAIEGRV